MFSLVTEWHAHSLTPTSSSMWAMGGEANGGALNGEFHRTVMTHDHYQRSCPLCCISVSIRNNDVRSTCLVSLSSVALMTSLVVAMRSWPSLQLQIIYTDQWPVPSDHTSSDITCESESWGHSVNTRLAARRHRQGLAPSMQTDGKYLNIHRIQL